MAAKKNAAGLGGALIFLGSLVYLYVVYSWYSSGAAVGGWLAAASFLGPVVLGVFVVSAITLFFMGLGALAGKMGSDKDMAMILWRFIILGGVTAIIAGGSGAFAWTLVGFVLTYIGGMAASM